MQDDILLKIENVKKYYPVKKGVWGRRAGEVRAVDDVSLELYEGETLGLVGESGCGKSTLGRQIVGLEKPDSGRILYKGEDLSRLDRKRQAEVRTQLQMVFQDPYSSLNPRKRIYDILTEPMIYHGLTDRAQAGKEARRLLELTGLSSHVLSRYPHEFSGGQRQRIGIARALSLNPRLLVCDEPVSALDVSIQAQILNLLRDIQEELKLACIFIGHGLGAVDYVSQRIAVMYLGRIVEVADSQELFDHPVHPYSQALFHAVPVPDPRRRFGTDKSLLEGEAALTIQEAGSGSRKGREGRGDREETGCPFYPRCPRRQESCRSTAQQLVPVSEGSSHLAACTPAAAALAAANTPGAASPAAAHESLKGGPNL